MVVNSRWVELGVGLFVALGLAALFMLAMKVSNLAAYAGGEDGYTISALFSNVGGLKVRAPVTMAGVRVGRVRSIAFDQDIFQARVVMDIDGQYRRIPADTMASIYTAGLLGEQYVALEPGGMLEYLQEGDEIRLTQSALVLEQVVGEFLFSKGGDAGGPAPPAPDPFAPLPQAPPIP
jgi:phospholipid/cholesterol/gamma-HCH transport system substrate-binding protein